MKTIGLIGGMSYESTIEYYRIINEMINKQLSGLHSAKMLIESYDFDEIEKNQAAENWELLTEVLINSAQKLQKAGADYIAIATNTMHLMADEVQDNISIPLIHIAEAAANYIKEKKLNINAKEFLDYFEAGNWIDSKGNKVKNWKQKILTWNNFEKGGTNGKTTNDTGQYKGIDLSTNRAKWNGKEIDDTGLI